MKDTLVKESNEQMLIKPVYTSEDWSSPKEVEIPGTFSLNHLGQYPFKRGPYATMYTHRPWTVR